MSHREIIALADKYLAEHQAELVNEATEIVDRWHAEAGLIVLIASWFSPALSWFESHLELFPCCFINRVEADEGYDEGYNVRSHLMERCRLSVISAYGYARHERASAPHKRMLRSSLSGASNMSKHY